MCGIVGYVGNRKVGEVLFEGIKRLEYRGYDSWGFAFLKNKKIITLKRAGKISDTTSLSPYFPSNSHTGIAHTRWATHGFPNEINAHPHLDCESKIAIVHNGIIENYIPLKKELEKEGHIFKSQTDSEVIAHMLEDYFSGDMIEALKEVMLRLVGTFGLAVISSYQPGKIYGVRRGSPLIIGVGNKEMFLSSDVNALVKYTRKVIYLEDDEIVSLTSDSFSITSLKESLAKDKEIHTIPFEAMTLEKEGYSHYMLKEIYKQPESLHNAFRGRLDYERATTKLGGLDLTRSELQQIKNVKLLGCGTSWHAALIGKYLLEDLAGIPAEVDYASEFRYRNPLLQENTLVIALSQSGETADTLAAIKEAKKKGAKVLGICNVVGSSIARECERGIYLHAGPEIGVASTKAFTSQVLVLTMLAIFLGRMRNLPRRDGLVALNGIEALPSQVERILKRANILKKIAEATYQYKNFLYIGRSYQFPVALEGALKLKEISYIHAEGMPAAELKHGSIALVDENMPTVVLATESHILDKVKSNVAEIKTRKGSILSIITEANHEMDELSDFTFGVSPAPEFLIPILSVVPLQLLAYYIAIFRGCDVDKPRNLAKSVTVE